MQKKINFWKEGFETEHYKVLSLSLQDELELSILNEYFSRFIKEESVESKKEGEEGKLVHYSVIDIELFKTASKTDEFKDNLESAADVCSRVLGEDQAAAVTVYGYIFLIPGLYLDIIFYKSTLKKK